MKILAVTTSLSEDSTTQKLSDRIVDAAASAGRAAGLTVETEHINVRSLSTALTDMALTGFRSEELEEAYLKVAEADAIITVTPVYKVAPVGLHTLFWQLIDEKALAGTPVLIASTGGTSRHSLAGETAMRPMLSYLKGIVVPTTVFAATDDWGSAEGGRALNSRVRQAGEELVALTASIRGLTGGEGGEGDEVDGNEGPDSLAPHRITIGRGEKRGVDDEFDPNRITPFAQLLEG
ncbi:MULTISPECIES: CE1759 family FMN reductase [Brevibacterium]|uniref:CE1759 family FMN reductase n=1 Tax=Brevibacterium TaxID=1696 RepID=UPI001BA4C176|nr:CE1759 family FMN reductase [Brevibacterium sp. W7.2]